MGGAVYLGVDLAATLARPSAQGADPEALEYLLLAAEPAALRRLNERQD